MLVDAPAGPAGTVRASCRQPPPTHTVLCHEHPQLGPPLGEDDHRVRIGGRGLPVHTDPGWPTPDSSTGLASDPNRGSA